MIHIARNIVTTEPCLSKSARKALLGIGKNAVETALRLVREGKAEKERIVKSLTRRQQGRFLHLLAKLA